MFHNPIFIAIIQDIAGFLTFNSCRALRMDEFYKMSSCVRVSKRSSEKLATMNQKSKFYYGKKGKRRTFPHSIHEFKTYEKKNDIDLLLFFLFSCQANVSSTAQACH